MRCGFEALKGKIFTDVILSEDKDVLSFICDNGEKYVMYHEQDCCEDVYLDDINGKLSDIIGSEILIADETSYSGEGGNPGGDDSWTWTFYRLATKKGWVVLRWYGSSNGYYSETADLFKVKEDENVFQ